MPARPRHGPGPGQRHGVRPLDPVAADRAAPGPRPGGPAAPPPMRYSPDAPVLVVTTSIRRAINRQGDVERGPSPPAGARDRRRQRHRRRARWRSEPPSRGPVVVVTEGDARRRAARAAPRAASRPRSTRGDSVEAHLRDTLAAGAGLCDAEAAAAICREGPAQVDRAALARGRLRPQPRAAAAGARGRPLGGARRARRRRRDRGPHRRRARRPRCGPTRASSSPRASARSRCWCATAAPPACARVGGDGRARERAGARRRARLGRHGLALPAHHQPPGRDGRRPGPGGPGRRRAGRPRAGAVPPHRAGARRRPARRWSARPCAARARCCATPAGAGSCPTSTRWPSWARATSWRARSPAAPPSWAARSRSTCATSTPSAVRGAASRPWPPSAPSTASTWRATRSPSPRRPTTPSAASWPTWPAAPRSRACSRSASARRPGAHGANRLASNGLLEAAVLAAGAAEALAGDRGRLARGAARRPAVAAARQAGGGARRRAPPCRRRCGAACGVERDAEGIAAAARRAGRPPRGHRRRRPTTCCWSRRLAAAAAGLRTESRGAHFRRDHPRPDPAQARRIAWVGGAPFHVPSTPTPGGAGPWPWRPHDHHRDRSCALPAERRARSPSSASAPGRRATRSARAP